MQGVVLRALLRAIERRLREHRSGGSAAQVPPPRIHRLDMDSIESADTALDKYTGTLLFVSHDREFVSTLAKRILKLKSGDGDRLLRQLRGLHREREPGAAGRLIAPR